MRKSKRWKILLGGLVLLAALTYGCESTTTGWQTISTTFGKADKPYGGGAFRIHGNDVISLKTTGPELKFKPASELKNPDVAEFTEAWMDDPSARLNRRTVAFLKGTLGTGLTRTFQQPGQDAAWWYSKDWRTVYVSTGWMDYKAAQSSNGQTPQITKLWRSINGGQSWKQLNWQADHNIGRLLFLDPQRGYAVGKGPHVWRTSDSGQSWREVKMPPLSGIGTPRATFDAVNLGPDGLLRVAYYVKQLGDIKASTVIDRMSWNEAGFEQDVVLPNQTIVDLQSSPASPTGYSVYALTRLGSPRNLDDSNDTGHRTGALSVWANVRRTDVQQLQTFDDHLSLDALSVGKQGVLLVYATDATGDGAPRDLTFVSEDFGKSWRKQNDETSQGGYFDPDTNTQYALSAYTPKKRGF